jgi:glycosyltransferase involved in cell wall biosynthesis
LPEITGDGRYGFTVDEPRPGQLADAIIEALSSPDRLRRMGDAGQRHVLDNFSWQRVARRIAHEDA